MSSSTSSRSIFTISPSTMSPSLKSRSEASMATISSSGVRSRSGAALVVVFRLDVEPSPSASRMARTTGGWELPMAQARRAAVRDGSRGARKAVNANPQVTAPESAAHGHA